MSLMGLSRSLPAIDKDAKGAERREELQRAIAAVCKTGKARQFVKLGHIYRQMGERGHALAVYQRALDREPNNVGALRGCAAIERASANRL